MRVKIEKAKELFVFKLFREAKIGRVKVILLLLFIALQMGGTLYLPTLTADIINNGVMLGDQEYVLRIGVIMLCVATLTGIVSILGTYFSAEVTTIFAKNTRKKLFNHIQTFSLQDFHKFKTASLITRATNDIEQLQSTFSMFFEIIIPAPFIILIGMFLAYSKDPYMAFIIFIASVILVIALGLIAKTIFPLFDRVQKGLDKINDKVSQYISGIRVIRAFNRTELEQEQVNAAFTDLATINIKINRIFAVLMPFVYLVMNIATVAIVWFGGIRISSENMQVGDFVAVIAYAINILMYLLMAAFVVAYIPRAKVCAARIHEVLEYNPEMSDGEEKLHDNSDLSLEFRDVSFAYNDAENPVLHNISFLCKQGTTTAIIGGTGSGKSTIAKLIPRFLDATKGNILLNGCDIRALSQRELRQTIGFVPQRAFLFSGSIADNLRHGNKEAGLLEMQYAAKIAQVEDFIEELEGGFDAPVAQGGKNFSGGQRQRLAIARMLMKKPGIYVFDDSFSALDFKTDAALRMALKDVTREAIVIYIAQRIGTIKDADQIIVLDNGKIAGIGTHHELLKNCEMYLEIAKSQFSEEELQQ